MLTNHVFAASNYTPQSAPKETTWHWTKSHKAMYRHLYTSHHVTSICPLNGSHFWIFNLINKPLHLKIGGHNFFCFGESIILNYYYYKLLQLEFTYLCVVDHDNLSQIELPFEISLFKYRSLLLPPAQTFYTVNVN